LDNIINLLFDPLQYGFMLRALAVSILIGIICPVIGSYVVIRGLAFMGDAIAHAILPGLVIGFLIGVSPVVSAIPVGILIAFLIGYLSRKTGLSEDTSIGILFAGLFAFGLILLSLFKSVRIDLSDILLGQVLGVSQNDIMITGLLVIIVLITLIAFHKELVFAGFDPQGASIIGLPTNLLDYLLLGLTAVVIVISIQAVGVILVMAMLVTPAATAYLLARNFKIMMLIGPIIGIIATSLGLYSSFYWNIPSGPAMTLATVALFTLTVVFKRMIRN
jgi:manganese/iron transport system permease protein